MANIDQLVKKSKNEAKMRPVLPLGQPLSLGAVGFIDGGAFRYMGTAHTMLGVDPGPADSGVGMPDVEIESGRDFSMRTYAKGETAEGFGQIASGKARAEVSFSSADAFMMAGRGLTVSTLTEPGILAAAMVRAFHAGLWEERFCLVYQIAAAKNFTAVLSEQSQSKLLLTGGASLGKGNVSLGDLTAGVKVSSQKGSMQKLVAGRNVVAFFNAYQVDDRILRSDRVKTAMAGVTQDTWSLSAAELDQQLRLPKKRLTAV